MIAVISDDFTGAAEIGGIGIRHGFTVTIDTEVNENYDCDILIIATNSRSLDITTAEKQITQLTRSLQKLKPDLIFKKIDSVLRGKVGAELLILMKILNKKRALLIPANPTLNRTIENGTYYFNSTPLMESNFFSNPNGKENSSSIFALLGEKYKKLISINSHNEDLLDVGFIVGNTKTEDDVDNWVHHINENTLSTGGASFFNAILKTHKTDKQKNKKHFSFGKKALYVCGSTFQPSKLAVGKVAEQYHNVSLMPSSFFCYNQHKTLINNWAEKITNQLETTDKVIVAIDELECRDVENLSQKIKDSLAQVVQKILEMRPLDELIIEGGATAYAIVNKLGYKKFYPQQELAPGVIRMKIEQNETMHITLKPGSYTWPTTIWNFSNIKKD